jgi:hypothetical protein
MDVLKGLLRKKERVDAKIARVKRELQDALAI